MDLHLSRDDSFLFVRIVDTGQGISAELIPHLFEHFSRDKLVASGAQGGLGLSLAIARQLVELHGGTVVAESRGAGLGSTFVVQLPLCAEPVAAGEHAAPALKRSLEGLSVLLAEADIRARFNTQRSLERAGARVLTAESMETALALADQADVTGERIVLVSELETASVNGHELVARLATRRQRQQRPPVPACALGASTDRAAQQLAIESGFDMFLSKPLTPEQLISAVADLGALG